MQWNPYFFLSFKDLSINCWGSSPQLATTGCTQAAGISQHLSPFSKFPASAQETRKTMCYEHEDVVIS